MKHQFLQLAAASIVFNDFKEIKHSSIAISQQNIIVPQH